MDGHPKKKNKLWGKQLYSDTRFSVIKWLEKELPLLSGDVINIGAGNWDVPRRLLNFSKITRYKTFDKKLYGPSKNKVDIYGDVQDMPKEWTNRWDAIICIEVIECVPNLFKAFEEMHRILKPGGILLLTCPFNYRAFGDGTWNDVKKDKKGINDYWRPTKQGLELLTNKFSQVNIKGFGGTGEHDRFVHCLRGAK